MTDVVPVRFPPRVVLASKFPPQYISETIVPSLTRNGVTVSRVVSTDYRGSIRDGEVAVLFMFQYCSHSDYSNFKKLAKTSGVGFIILPRQSSDWPNTFRVHNLRAVPPVNGAAIVAAASPPTPTPKPKSFGDGLRLARQREDVAQEVVADLCGVPPSTVVQWEANKAPIHVESYDVLTELFPDLSDLPAPEIIRTRRPVMPPTPTLIPSAVAAPAPVIVLPPPAPVIEAPVVPAARSPRSAAVAMDGLLRGARALGIAGPVHLTVDDGTAEVRIGDEKWPARTAEEAVLLARQGLDGRLSDLLLRVEQARAMLDLD